MRTWFNIAAKSGDTLEIDIFDEIGGWGITAKMFVEKLRSAGQFANIVINLDCPGGDCNEGFTIFDAIKASGANVVVNITGLAASMASVIMLAGNKIRIAENGRVMIHRVTGGVYGNGDELDAAAKIIKQFEDRIVGLYMARTGLDEATIRDMMKAQMGTWFFGQEAIDNGFADEVMKGTKARAFKNEWAHLFKSLPAALFDTRETTTPPHSPAKPSPMNKLFFALAALAGIAVKGDETEDQLEAAIKAHKPVPQKFEMNLEDPETKKLFDKAVQDGITAALPTAIENGVKPVRDELDKLKALQTSGALDASKGAPPVPGAKKEDEEKTTPRGRAVAAFAQMPVFATK